MSEWLLSKIRNRSWRGCVEKGTLVYRWWECKLVQTLWKTVWRFPKKLKIELWSSNFTSGYFSERKKNKTKHWLEAHCRTHPLCPGGFCSKFSYSFQTKVSLLIVEGKKKSRVGTPLMHDVESCWFVCVFLKENNL